MRKLENFGHPDYRYTKEELPYLKRMIEIIDETIQISGFSSELAHQRSAWVCAYRRVEKQYAKKCENLRKARNVKKAKILKYKRIVKKARATRIWKKSPEYKKALEKMGIREG